MPAPCEPCKDSCKDGSGSCQANCTCEQNCTDCSKKDECFDSTTFANKTLEALTSAIVLPLYFTHEQKEYQYSRHEEGGGEGNGETRREEALRPARGGRAAGAAGAAPALRVHGEDSSAATA
ncbi:hypothetical protein EVAR_54277_1 [Eumeta japonica]|uniref:Uncharacterized protein n=1 Tax=Eumeta variegata TaxID=151549 RepID=A0A4C1YSS5_EUMVA|nr:hypothetical protein EVAR_54277_1 [Eumeta japonica]